MKIAVLGLWHQGVVGAACLAEMRHDAVGADANAETIAKLKSGKAPLYEPGLDDLLEKGVNGGKLTFTTDVAAAVRGAPFVFVMFDTPVDENDESDLSGIFSTFDAIAPALEPGAIILVTAQVPVGTCDQLLARLKKAAPDTSVTIAYQPENLRLGQAIERFKAPPLPVIGCDDPAAFDKLLTVVGPLAPEWHLVSLRTAEMIKHALNGFLGLSICFANELGNICDEVGADGKRVGEMLRLEPRVGAKAMLLPGLGFSGGTLARDMQALRKLGKRFDLGTPLLDGAWAANETQNSLVVRKLAQVVPDLAKARVAVLGLTYKADTSTLRRSAALEVIGDLVKKGTKVNAHDPRADRQEIKAHTEFAFFEDPLAAVSGTDALVLMTPWADYRDLDFAAVKSRMAKPYVLDTAGLWNADELTRLGFAYDEIGRGRHPRTQTVS
ncbi:MAG: UDPglucose 6-dehydrogenase [Hyphomicrobiales bacterium]|jgi:UDPglucose 6-dehydrogenase|nr:UDPglucose 6-dehydrogenase [Hyphomicrobiales bacterium]